MVDQDENPRPERDDPRAPKQGLTDQYQRHPADHRVAEVAIRAGDDKFFRWIPRSQSPLADDRK